MKATAKDLRFHTRELFDSIERGEEVIITFRGKTCAKLIPFHPPADRADKHELFGSWRDHGAVEDVAGYLRNLRKARY